MSLAKALGDKPYLDRATFTAGDLMMTTQGSWFAYSFDSTSGRTSPHIFQLPAYARARRPRGVGIWQASRSIHSV
jgi:glutathione S-transferase